MFVSLLYLCFSLHYAVGYDASPHSYDQPFDELWPVLHGGGQVCGRLVHVAPGAVTVEAWISGLLLLVSIGILM